MRYLTRRDILKSIALGLVSAETARQFTPSFLFAAEPSPSRRNLVVIRLNGGMCSLQAFPFIGSTPHALAIRERRPLIAAPSTTRVIDSASQMAFHSAWGALADEFPHNGQPGSLRIIHGFGNRALQDGFLNLSHEFNQTLQAIGRADFDSQSDGWVARAMEIYHLDHSQVIGLGVSGGTEFRHHDAAMRPYTAVNLDDLTFARFDDSFFGGANGGAVENDRLIAAARALRQAHARAHPGSAVTQRIVTSLDQMEEATSFFAGINSYTNGSLFQGYSNSQLGKSLKGIAKSIGRLDQDNKAHLFFTGNNHAEWDSHDRQAEGMEVQIGDLGANLASFAADLRGLGNQVWERTTVITMSEFGRRVYDNGRGGTDHGMGTAALAFGGSVRGGLVMDSAAMMSTNWRTAEYVPVHVPFQNLLAQSMTWLGFNSDQLIDPRTYDGVGLELFRQTPG